MLPDDYIEMTHRYVDKSTFDSEVKKHGGVYKYNLYSKEKHGESYLGTLDNVDFLDESTRGK